MVCFAPEKYYRRDPARFAGVGGLTKDAKKALRGGAPLIVACGKCSGCRLARAHEWSLRVMHEAKFYDVNSFVTLTYRSDMLPPGENLRYRDFQLFMHRLRKAIPGGGRFFMCGEYGENNDRPHYHAILFGVDFPDKVLFKSKPSPIFTSKVLSDLWRVGFASIGAVSLSSAGYVARYSMKKITGKVAGDFYSVVTDDGEVIVREPPFLRCSLKPGIGYRWFERYHSDVFPCDYLVYDGRKFPVPRYYSKLFEELSASEYRSIQLKRVASTVEAKARPDNQSRRLADRAEVERLNSRSFKRDLS